MASQFPGGTIVRRTPNSRPRRGPQRIAVLAAVLIVAALAIAFLLMNRTDAHQSSTVPATIAALRTALTGQQQQVAAQKTEIAVQQHRIAQLQTVVPVQKTPANPADGAHSYIASFQLDTYSYVLYLQWTESNGFIRAGQLRTADNYAHKAVKSLQFTGVDDNGSIGFTGADGKTTLTFTGTLQSTGTITVTGLPWSLFEGFVGGTFTQTLHPGTLQDFNAAVASMADPPH